MTIYCPKCQTDNPEDSKYCKECSASLPLSEDIPNQTKTLVTPIQKLTKGISFAGRYEILEELGRGGMGVVHKANDTKLKRTVALKFLPPELTHIQEVKDRFVLEAQAAASLDHPNICTVYEFDEAEEKSFISMAYIQGQSLKKKIVQEPLSLDEGLRIVTQSGEGLREAHSKGVVHRDIKSANIMVTDKGLVKIMDFGLARISGSSQITKDGTTMGTVAYMSPEQARGEGVDQRTDIWSLGVVLYEILSGQLPFKGEHDQSVVYSILNEEPIRITDLDTNIPQDVEQVLGRALEKNPDDRYQNIDEFIQDLKSITEGRQPEGIVPQRRKSMFLKSKRAVLSAVTAGIFLVLIVTILFLLTGRIEAVDSIAVLPLENLSQDPGQEYLSDGITDALINELAKIRALDVRARQSIMQYKGSDKLPSDIAQELNVDVLVEASVQMVKDRIQIRVQLILAQKEQILWADSFEREISDILMLQSELAHTIAKEIHIALTPEEEKRLASAGRVDPEIYQDYLKGQFHAYKLTQQDLEIALKYYQSILEKDSDFALAYAGIAFAWMGHMAQGTANPQVAAPKAKAAALKALELDSTLAEAQSVLAIIYMTEWDWEKAEKVFKRAIELNPNSAFAHGYYSHLLYFIGHSEEAMGHADRAIELDPFNALFQALHGMALMFTHRYDDAITLMQNTLKTSPNDLVALSTLRSAFHQKQMYEEAMKIWKKSYAVRGDLEAEEALELGYKENGYRGALKRVAEILVERSRTTYVTPWQIGTLYSRAGMPEEALEWLEKAFEERDVNVPYLSVDPIFDELRDDSRFKDMIRRLNLPEKINDH